MCLGTGQGHRPAPPKALFYQTTLKVGSHIYAIYRFIAWTYRQNTIPGSTLLGFPRSGAERMYPPFISGRRTPFEHPSKILSAYPLLIFINYILITAVAGQAKELLQQFTEMAPRKQSRVELTLLAHSRAIQKYPNPDPRPDRTRVAALTAPKTPVVVLAADLDLLEATSNNAPVMKRATKTATPKKTHFAGITVKGIQVASWLSRSKKHVRPENARDVTLRSLRPYEPTFTSTQL